MIVPYEIPKRDADLWKCGVVLSTAERTFVDARNAATPREAIRMVLELTPARNIDLQRITGRRYETVRAVLEAWESTGFVVCVAGARSRFYCLKSYDPG